MKIRLLLVLVWLAPTLSGSVRAATHWVGTWGTSPGLRLGSAAEMQKEGFLFHDETLRQAVRISLGGEEFRLCLSNAYNPEPVTLDAVHLARRDRGSRLLPGSDRVVTFGGRTAITLTPNARVLSDPILLTAPAGAELLVSLHVAGRSFGGGVHYDTLQAVYAVRGDRTAAEIFPDDARKVTGWVFLSGLSVRAPARASAIVLLGDSLTDGACSTFDANRRWPDQFADRLNAAGRGRGVVNAGISGNCLLTDPARWLSDGENALARLERDVFAAPGVSALLVLEGTNDIGTHAVDPARVGALIAALQQIAARGHERGLKVYVGTLLPFSGAGYFSAEKEAQRQALNAWIRASTCFDGVVDFDQIIRDPTHPERLRAEYDSGDHLHANDAGYAAMARAVPLDWFK
ncbi:SGNH/GDSL hydrolase family protein [Oleiharenicola lentus]|uniref:SGNH/GDSL hydrolase family protein n=1 Tax=Oleiharenicola lentus TaxID=2508720 RepID=A0A4Q1C4Z5_9BACT|nr:SGNH/GDSL hydrolase family protein [Oleiharenicola lentus]